MTDYKHNKLALWLMTDPRPMTQMAFAEAIGVTPTRVSQLIREEAPWPGREVARRIAIVTEGAVTPNDLAGYSCEH